MARLRAQRPGTNVTELMKEVAALWRATPEAEKEARKLAAAKAKAQWEASRPAA